MIAALLIVLLVALVQWRAARNEAHAEATHPPAGQILTVDGLPVHALVIGTGPDLVMIHGASGNLNDFTMGLTARLADRYRVILFDRPGLGWTARLPGSGGAWNNKEETPQKQAAFLQEAADQLGVRNPIVLGHSYGGSVALAWGLSRPGDTAALVLVSAVSEPWPGSLGWTYRLFGTRWGGALVVPLVTALLPERFVSGSIGTIFRPQDAPLGYAEHLGVGLTLRRNSFRANAQQVNGLRPHIVEMQRSYDSLTMPIEVLHGDSDTIVPAHIHAEVLMNDIPDGNLVLLLGEGHMPHHTAMAEVEDAVDRAAVRSGLR